LKKTDVSEDRTASIIRETITLMMKAVGMSQTTVYFNGTTTLYLRRL
jgi:hypothetical protein